MPLCAQPRLSGVLSINCFAYPFNMSSWKGFPKIAFVLNKRRGRVIRIRNRYSPRRCSISRYVGKEPFPHTTDCFYWNNTIYGKIKRKASTYWQQINRRSQNGRFGIRRLKSSWQALGWMILIPLLIVDIVLIFKENPSSAQNKYQWYSTVKPEAYRSIIF